MIAQNKQRHDELASERAAERGRILQLVRDLPVAMTGETQHADGSISNLQEYVNRLTLIALLEES
jgi:hypothetical protein